MEWTLQAKGSLHTGSSSPPLSLSLLYPLTPLITVVTLLSPPFLSLLPSSSSLVVAMEITEEHCLLLLHVENYGPVPDPGLALFP